MRIAFIGGTEYNEVELEDFLYKLHAKYPDATIVTGAGRGAEKQVKTLLDAIGQTVEVPPLHNWAKSPGDLQIAEILGGQFKLLRSEDGKTKQVYVTAPADYIVIVGRIEAARASIAHAIWKRCDAWREPDKRRPLHIIAAPPEKKKVTKPRAKKKRETLAV